MQRAGWGVEPARARDGSGLAQSGKCSAAVFQQRAFRHGDQGPTSPDELSSPLHELAESLADLQPDSVARAGCETVDWHDKQCNVRKLLLMPMPFLLH